MSSVHRSVLVPYSDAQMFDLVRAVERYPEFLPWCPSSRVLAAPAEATIVARVDIAYLGVRSHFTTRNVHRAPHSIELTLVEGPFRDLCGTWSFRALSASACKVSVALEYGFATGLLGPVIAPVFERVDNSLVDAFAARARDLYGSVDL